MPSTAAPEHDIIHIVDPNLRHGFTQLPRLILKAPRLSNTAKLVYALLLDYAWQSGSCFPGQETLAADLNSTYRTVRRALTELKDVQLITWKRRGLTQTNVYYILDIAKSPAVASDARATEADGTFLSHQHRTPVSHQDRTKMSHKEYPEEKDSIEQDAEKSLLYASEEIYSSSRIATNEKIERGRGEEPKPAIAASTPRGFTKAGAVLTQRVTQPEPRPVPIRPQTGKPPRAPAATPNTPEYTALRAYMKTLRARFTDFASEQSSTTRAYHLFQEAQESRPTLDISAFIGYLEQAASVTAERGGQLRYWFSVLEDLLSPKPKQPRRDTSGYHTPRRRKAVGGPYVRVAPLPDESPL